jgi:hypothetical protein
MGVVQSAFAHLGEDGEVEEVHAAEHEEDESDLGAEGLEGFLGVGGAAAVFQGEADVADVDEVKADDEKVIDGIGQLLVPKEAVDKEDASVFVEGAGDPDGEGDTDGEVGEISGDEPVHRSFPSWCRYFLSLQKYNNMRGREGKRIPANEAVRCAKGENNGEGSLCGRTHG